MALGPADAVVGGDGDVLHILDHRDARVRGGALVLVGAHADLVEDGPVVVLINAAVLEGLVHAELVVAVVLDGLRQVLHGVRRGLARVDAQIDRDVAVALRRDVLVVLRPAGRLGGHGPVVADHVGQQDRVRAAVGHVAQGADGVRHAVAHAQERRAEGHAGHRGGVVHLLLGAGALQAGLAVDGLSQVVPDELGMHQGTRVPRQRRGRFLRHPVGQLRVGAEAGGVCDDLAIEAVDRRREARPSRPWP